MLGVVQPKSTQIFRGTWQLKCGAQTKSVYLSNMKHTKGNDIMMQGKSKSVIKHKEV